MKKLEVIFDEDDAQLARGLLTRLYNAGGIALAAEITNTRHPYPIKILQILSQHGYIDFDMDRGSIIDRLSAVRITTEGREFIGANYVK